MDQDQNELIDFNITDQLFFEILLVEIRGKTISSWTFEKKQETVEEQNLITELESLENHDSIDVVTVQLMEDVKKSFARN